MQLVLFCNRFKCAIVQIADQVDRYILVVCAQRKFGSTSDQCTLWELLRSRLVGLKPCWTEMFCYEAGFYIVLRYIVGQPSGLHPCLILVSRQLSTWRRRCVAFYPILRVYTQSCAGPIRIMYILVCDATSRKAPDERQSDVLFSAYLYTFSTNAEGM